MELPGKQSFGHFSPETYPYDLRTRVVWTAARGFQHAAGWLQRSHPKVRYLNVILLVQQQVLGLQVPMAVSRNKSSIDCSSKGSFHRVEGTWTYQIECE